MSSNFLKKGKKKERKKYFLGMSKNVQNIGMKDVFRLHLLKRKTIKMIHS